MIDGFRIRSLRKRFNEYDVKESDFDRPMAWSY